jgi:hypothetical protein
VKGLRRRRSCGSTPSCNSGSRQTPQGCPSRERTQGRLESPGERGPLHLRLNRVQDPPRPLAATAGVLVRFQPNAGVSHGAAKREPARGRGKASSHWERTPFAAAARRGARRPISRRVKGPKSSGATEKDSHG